LTGAGVEQIHVLHIQLVDEVETIHRRLQVEGMRAGAEGEGAGNAQVSECHHWLEPGVAAKGAVVEAAAGAGRKRAGGAEVNVAGQVERTLLGDLGRYRRVAARVGRGAVGNVVGPIRERVEVEVRVLPGEDVVGAAGRNLNNGRDGEAGEDSRGKVIAGQVAAVVNAADEMERSELRLKLFCGASELEITSVESSMAWDKV